MNKPPEANAFVPLGIWLLGLTPVVMVLLPWDFGNEMTFYRGFMRGNSLPVTIVEFGFVLLATARGFSPAASVAALPRLTKVGMLLFSGVSVWTTIFVAQSAIAASLGMVKLFAHVIFGLAIAHQLKGWSIRQREFIWPAIGLGVVGFCLLWGVNIVFYHPVGEDWVWLVPTLTNIRWVGFFALAGFCAGVGLLGIAAEPGQTWRCFLAGMFFAALGLAIALWTGSRGPLVAIVVSAVLTSLALGNWRKMAPLAVTSTAVALAITVSLPVPHPTYGIDRILGDSNLSDGVADMSSGRVQTWIDTVGKIGQRPVAGWGIDQFRYSGPEESLGLRHPHQGILQLLFSSGLLGSVAMFMMAVPLAIRVPRKLALPHQQAALAYVFGALVYGLYDGFFYYTYPVMTLLVAVACLIAPAPPALSDKSG